MSSIGERILEIQRHYFGNKRGSKTEFAKAVGENPNTVSNWFGRKDGIGDAVINKILSTFPEVDKGWLVGGNGKMLINPKQEESNSKYSDIEGKAIPLLPVSAQGGRLNNFIVSVRESECERVVSPIKDADFAIPISGDSMAPEYPNGSQVHVKKINEKAFIEWGRVYVLDTCNGTVIKRIAPSEKEGYIKCLSINPDPIYAPFEVCLNDVYGIYRVMLCLSIK